MGIVNICQLCMDLLRCNEVLYHLFVFFALKFAYICVLVSYSPVIILGLGQELPGTEVNVYFRQKNRTGRAEQSKGGDDPH